jgi:GT2 family glycosyltransferase
VNLPARQSLAPASPGSVVEPRVTVVVASRNRREELLTSLRRHEGPAVLVDNGSTDGTAEAVRAELPHVEVIALDRNLGAAARNLGVDRARTPYVAFADDDSWFAPGALTRAAAHLDRHPRLGLLSARVLVGPQERLDPVSEQMAAAPLGTPADLPGPSILGFLACSVVARREALAAVGGFERLLGTYGEEQLLAVDLLALGWGLAYAEDVVAHHHPSPNRAPSGHRRRRELRNALLTRWMRWPAAEAWRASVEAARSGRDGPAAVAAAARRLPSAWAARRVLPLEVRRDVARLAAEGG